MKFSNNVKKAVINNIKKAAPLKYSIEMRLINCQINLISIWSENCVISNATGATTFPISNTNLYILVLTLPIQYNAKLLQQLKSGFKSRINWNKYQSKLETSIGIA